VRRRRRVPDPVDARRRAAGAGCGSSHDLLEHGVSSSDSII
jgi:hypothetical protein